jgi:hypothetical protein
MYFYFLIKAIKVLSFIFLIAVAIVLAILLKKK